MSDSPPESQAPTPAPGAQPSPSPASIVGAPLGVPPGAGVLDAAQVLMPGLAIGQAAVQLQVWQGQFPPPDVVEAYERVSPGALGRLIAMAETQQAAQIDLNREGARAARADVRRGHYLGAGVTLAAIAAAVACAWLRQPWVAGMLCGVPVLSVANILVANARGVAAVRAASGRRAAESAPSPDADTPSG